MSIFEWDGISPVAYCEGRPMPGIPLWDHAEQGAPVQDEINDPWHVLFQLENGVEFLLWCGYRTPGPKVHNLEGRPHDFEGEAALWVPIPVPEGKTPRPNGLHRGIGSDNACMAWLIDTQGRYVTEGIPNNAVAIGYAAECEGHWCMCMGSHDTPAWGETFRSYTRLAKALHTLSQLRVVAMERIKVTGRRR